MESNWLTISGAAQKLGIPEATVRSWERAGKIEAVRDSSGRRLFDRAAIENFRKQRERKTKPERKRVENHGSNRN